MGREDVEPEDIDYYFEYTGSLAVSVRVERKANEQRRLCAGDVAPLSTFSSSLILRHFSLALALPSPPRTHRPRATTTA